MLASIIASSIYSQRNISVIKQLTVTTRQLGEGKYHSFAIPGR